MGMILFETTTSIFELLWDIVLAFFIIRLAFFYFLLSFTTGALITYLRMANFTPLKHFIQPHSELITLPLWLLFSTLWARFMIVNYEIPRVAGFRLAIGGAAMVMMLGAELLGGVFMYETGMTEWVWETDPAPATCGGVVLLLFGLMPTLLMGVEQETDEIGKTYHGHEKSSVVAAVPTIAIVDKDVGKKRD